MNDCPAPFTPADCDLKDFQFMPLDVQRLRDSGLASSEPPECCWAALLIWCASWHQVPAGSIPDDDKWIADKAGYVSRGRVDPQWKKVRDGALRGWTQCADGRLYHDVVSEKALEAWIAKLTQRHTSGVGNLKRWGTPFDDEPAILAAITASRKLLATLNPQSSVLKKRPPKHSHSYPGGIPGGNENGIPSLSQETGTGEETGEGIGILSSNQHRASDDDGTPNQARVDVVEWQPLDDVYLSLEIELNIPCDFATAVWLEFKAYWSGKTRLTTAEWKSRFVQRVRDQWDRRSQLRVVS